MDAPTKQKLIVPFIVLIGLLALNINSIVNGISQHNTSKVVVASASGVLVIICFILIIRSSSRKNNNGEV